jgi:hypothetical protein
VQADTQGQQIDPAEEHQKIQGTAHSVQEITHDANRWFISEHGLLAGRLSHTDGCQIQQTTMDGTVSVKGFSPGFGKQQWTEQRRKLEPG